jgi:hypothetical protein
MNIILILGAIASLAALGSGARVAWRTYADKRRIQKRLKEYASR